MRNVYDVIREKENELRQVSKEVYALRLAAPLLAEEADIKEAMKATEEIKLP